jgi:type VI secretion system secreted protein Hcp
MADTFFFLKLEGIQGESQDTDHSGEIDIMSFSISVTNAGTYDAGTGGNTGKCYFGDMNIMKYMDKSSPTLLQYCAGGTAIPTATISVNKQAGEDKKVEYVKITLHNAVITSVVHSGSGGSTEPIPESLSLNFAGLEYDYTQQSNTGEAMGVTHFGRDIQKNTHL